MHEYTLLYSIVYTASITCTIVLRLRAGIYLCALSSAASPVVIVVIAAPIAHPYYGSELGWELCVMEHA